MATLKRVYKGGKKAAVKKTKEQLVNALYKVYKPKKVAAVGRHKKVAAVGRHKKVAAVGRHKKVAAVGRHKKVSGVKYKPKHMRLFIIQYMGPTNYKGSRIKITDTRHKISITKSWGYDTDSLISEAMQHFKSVGIPIAAYGANDIDKKDYALSPNFDKNLKTGLRNW
jgi:hypothetical protein